MMIEPYGHVAPCLLGRVSIYFLLIALPSVSIAAEWTATPSLGVQQSYNDNIRLTTLPHPNVTTTTIKPKIDFGWATERANIDLLGEWMHNQYAGDPNLENITDRKYELKSGYKTERSQFSLDGAYVKDTTLAQEDYSEDIGVTLAQLKRETKKFIPTWSWNMTERSNLRLDFQYQDVTYEKTVISSRSFNDYSYDNVGLTYSYQWMARDQVYIVVKKSRYDSKPRELVPANEVNIDPSKPKFLGSGSDTMSYELGLNHQLSSTFKVGLGYGQRYSEAQAQYQECIRPAIAPPYVPPFTFECGETAEIQRSSKTKAPIYTLSANKYFELTQLGIKLSRTVSASGQGSELDIDSLDFNIDRRFTEKVSLEFKFNASQRISVNPDFSANDRNSLRGEVNLGWKLDRNWKLSTKYRYIRQRYKKRDDAASSNSISLNIRYSWDRFSRSW